MFPRRSGAEVVFLEQAYPRPRYLIPIAFAVTSVMFSCVLNSKTKMTLNLTASSISHRFSATNSIVFAQYVLAIFEIPPTEVRQTALATGVVTFCVASKSFRALRHTVS